MRPYDAVQHTHRLSHTSASQAEAGSIRKQLHHVMPDLELMHVNHSTTTTQDDLSSCSQFRCQHIPCVLVQDEGQPRFSVPDLQAQLEPLLNGLFGAFKMPESGENEYLMKCVMRLIAFVGPQARLCPSLPLACRFLAEPLFS